MISDDVTKVLVQRSLKPPKTLDIPVPSHEKLRCPCGGSLQAFRRVSIVGDPPPHKKKRIAKKWRKRWEEKHRWYLVSSMMVSILQPPFFRCTRCGRLEGFYSAVGCNMFGVQALPGL